MPNSYKKRRTRTEPLRRLRRYARTDLREVELTEGIRLSEPEAARLADAATEFANPWICADRDALLPAHRPDLRRQFFLRALHLEERSARALLSIARDLAPSPDLSAPPWPKRFGERRLPTYGEVKRTYQHLPRQRRMRRPTTTT